MAVPVTGYGQQSQDAQLVSDIAEASCNPEPFQRNITAVDLRYALTRFL
jgi:hypothetical protein